MLKDYQIKRIKEQYPKGTEIELISMEDSQAVPSGTHGIVDFVDDMGTIQMTWDNGSSLGLIIGEDQFKVIKTAMDVKLEELEKIKTKLLKDDNLFLHVQNIETGLSGVASFYNDGETIKVFAGNSDGSDDIELNYLDFINHYNYIVGKEFENPFMDIKI